MAADTQILKYLVQFDAAGLAQFQKSMKGVKTDMDGFDMSMKKMSASAGIFGMDIGKLAARAAITIPIWLAMRTAFMGTLKTIGDGAKYIGEFDAALRKMQAVSSEVSNMPAFIKQLGNEIRSLSTQTGRSITDISNIYIQLAETGMKASTAQAGMTVALKLAIGTFSEAKDVGRIMVDLYNLFGDTMDKNLSPMEKMQMIGGTFTSLWKENSGTLMEYINALKMFAPVAKLNNLSMQETLTTAVVLNNYMQRGTMGGTQLQRAFTEIAKNADKFDKLGVNVRGRTDGMKMFLDVLTAINKTPIDEKNSLLSKLFGERSQRGTSVLSTDQGLTKLIDQLKNTKNLTLADAVKSLNENFMLQNKSLETQVKIFDQLRKQAGAAFLIGIMGATDYEDAIKKAGEALLALNQIMDKKVIPGLRYFGNIINIVVTDSVVKWGIALSGVLLIIRSLITVLPLLWAAATSNPIGAVILGIAAASVAASAAIAKIKADTLDVKTKFLQSVSEGAASGVPIEEFLNKYKVPEVKPTTGEIKDSRGNVLNKPNLAGNVQYGMTQEMADQINKANRLKQIAARGGASDEEIMKAYAAPAENAAEETRKAEELAATEFEKAKPGLDLKQSLLLTERLKALGYDSLQIEVEKYRVMKAAHVDAVQLAEQEQKILEEQLKLVNEYAGIIQSKLTTAFTDIMAGTAGLRSITSALNNALVEGYRKTMAESVTNMIMSTGLGDIFGGAMGALKGAFGNISGKIEGAFDTGGRTTYSWIVRGFNDGRSGNTTPAAVMSATGGVGGAYGISSITGGGIFNQGWFAQPISGGTYNAPNMSTPNGPVYVNPSGVIQSSGGKLTRGNVAYMGVQGAVTGYSSYQSARGGGSNQFGAVAGGVLGGLGGVAGIVSGGLMAGGFLGGATATAAGALLGMGPAGWAVLGAGLALAAMFTPMLFGGSKPSSQTSIQTQTMEKTVGTKIDVSNKKLELINRNLVALKNTMETYIMPQSTYFSTARNLEDEFSISARRG